MHHAFRSASLVVAMTLFVAACRRPPSSEPVERAPFEVVDGGALRVREDLLASIRTVEVRASEGAARLEGFGHVGFAPGASYAVRAPFDGYVERVDVQVGDRLVADTVLATLRSSEVARMRADLRRQTAALETERDALERIDRLVGEHAASSRDLVEVRGRVSALDAEVAGLRGALAAARTGAVGGDTVILRAPKAGDLLARHIEPGERVHAADPEPAFLIGNSRSLVVVGNFPERDSSLLVDGSACSFTIPSIGDDSFDGRVTSVVRAIDPRTRSIRVFCAPSRVDPRLRSEMAARVSLAVGVGGTLVVPRSAVLLRRDERVVLVRTSANEVVRRAVTTGLAFGSDIQILAGLRAGELVVSEGAVLLDGELDQLL
jgi:cobalt-zinc-cadmium efflux system membrane fusion protein